MHIQYSPRRFYPNLPDSCRARDLSTLRVFLFYLHSNRNFSTRTRGNTLRETKEGKGFVYSPGIREFGSIRRIERVFRVSRIVGVRVSVACFYEEYPFEMSREEKRSANGGRGRVSCTLLYYFSGIIYFRLFYLHGPRNRIPGETVSGETRVMMSSAMRVNNVRVLPPSFPFHPFHSLLYLCAINRSCDLPHEVEIEARKFWITRT